VLREYVEANLKKRRIRNSASPPGTPIDFVQRKDGTLRLSIDYCRLYEITIKHLIAVPLFSEGFHLLVNVKVYCQM
jgi:hypothetical protein